MKSSSRSPAAARVPPLLPDQCRALAAARRDAKDRVGPTKDGPRRSIGAEEVIDYTRDDFADGSRRRDVIVDTPGPRPLSTLRRALTPKATLVIVGGDGGEPCTRGFFRGVLRAPLLSLFVGGCSG